MALASAVHRQLPICCVESNLTQVGQKIRAVRVSLCVSVKCICHRADLHGGRRNCYTVFGENRTDCVVCDTTSQTDGWTWSACKSLSLCKERLNLSTEFNSHSRFKTDQPFSEIWEGEEAVTWWPLGDIGSCVTCHMSHVILGEVCGSYSGATAWLTNSHTLRQAGGVGGTERTVSWCLPAPKGSLGRRGVAPLVLNFGTASGWEIIFTLWPVCSGEKSARNYYFMLNVFGEILVVGWSSYQMRGM